MVYEYFKKDFENFKILIQLNPVDFRILELTIDANNAVVKREIQADEDIYEDLKEDEFIKSSPLEFNLHLKGVR